MHYDLPQARPTPKRSHLCVAHIPATGTWCWPPVHRDRGAQPGALRHGEALQQNVHWDSGGAYTLRFQRNAPGARRVLRDRGPQRNPANSTAKATSRSNLRAAIAQAAGLISDRLCVRNPRPSEGSQRKNERLISRSEQAWDLDATPFCGGLRADWAIGHRQDLRRAGGKPHTAPDPRWWASRVVVQYADRSNRQHRTCLMAHIRHRTGCWWVPPRWSSQLRRIAILPGGRERLNTVRLGLGQTTVPQFGRSCLKQTPGEFLNSRTRELRHAGASPECSRRPASPRG